MKITALSTLLFLMLFCSQCGGQLSPHLTPFPVAQAITEVCDWYSTTYGVNRDSAMVFMTEIGFLESRLGMDPGTYYPGGAYGWAQIWENGVFRYVKEGLEKKPQRVAAIRGRWGFDPLKIHISYLDSSDIASAVFLREFLMLRDPNPLPNSLKDRGEWWATYYGWGHAYDYMTSVMASRYQINEVIDDYYGADDPKDDGYIIKVEDDDVQQYRYYDPYDAPEVEDVVVLPKPSQLIDDVEVSTFTVSPTISDFTPPPAINSHPIDIDKVRPASGGNKKPHDNKLAVYKVIGEVSEWYETKYPELVPDAEKVAQVMLEIGNVETMLGTHPHSYRSNIPSLGWAQFNKAKRNVAFFDVTAALNKDLNEKGWPNSRAKAIRDMWGFNAVDVPAAYRQAGWDSSDWKGIDAYYFVSDDIDAYGRSVGDYASAVFELEFILVAGKYTKYKTANGDIGLKYYRNYAGYDNVIYGGFDVRARWWESVYNSFADPLGTYELYSRKNSEVDGNGYRWIYDGPRDHPSLGVIEMYYLEDTGAQTFFVDNKLATSVYGISLSQPKGCLEISYCDNRYSRTYAEELSRHIKTTDAWNGGSLAIAVSGTGVGTSPYFSTQQRHEIRRADCEEIAIVSFWYPGCGNRGEYKRLVQESYEKESYRVDPRFIFELESIAYSTSARDFIANAVLGGLIRGGAYVADPTGLDSLSLRSECADAADVISQKSRFLLSSTNTIYLVREGDGAPLSGEAYRLLPHDIVFDTPLEIEMYYGGKAFYPGDGIYVFKYGEDEIPDYCEISVTDSITTEVGGSEEIVMMGDLRLRATDDALSTPKNLTIDRLSILCNDADVLQNGQKDVGNAIVNDTAGSADVGADTASNEMPLDIRHAIELVIILVLITFVYFVVYYKKIKAA